MAYPAIVTDCGNIVLPCMEPELVPIDRVRANDYNPNHVSERSMRDLLQSIRSNGLCYAITTVYDPDSDTYTIVDGYHRYSILRSRGASYVPVVVLDQTMDQRITATVQFNRARGVHQVDGMSNVIRLLIGQGVREDDIAVRLGMDVEEILRLKQAGGIAQMYTDHPYGRSWGVEGA